MTNLTFEVDGNVGVITISRPESMNALTFQTLKEIDQTLDVAAENPDILTLVITGSGSKAFVAGADISEMRDMDAFEARELSRLGNRVLRKIETFKRPVIAAVNGYALGGGCEMALSCDIRIAAENAVFGQPEVGLGITPGFGGTQRLARTIGAGMAKELIYTGRTVKAEEAVRIGLVNRVVPKENILDEAMKLARRIAANAPIAVSYSKEAINRGLQSDIDTGISYEAEVFAQCFASQDQKEGMSAFLNKTKVERFNNK